MKNKYKKSELTRFAKTCSYGLNQMLNGVCVAEEISTSDIGHVLRNNIDEELLLEISKRFAKCTIDNISFNTETSSVEDFKNIIDMILKCCNENDWFQGE